MGWHWAWPGAGNVSLLVVRWHGRPPGRGEGRGSGLAWPLKAVSWVGTGGRTAGKGSRHHACGACGGRDATCARANRLHSRAATRRKTLCPHCRALFANVACATAPTSTHFAPPLIARRRAAHVTRPPSLSRACSREFRSRQARCRLESIRVEHMRVESIRVERMRVESSDGGSWR